MLKSTLLLSFLLLSLLLILLPFCSSSSAPLTFEYILRQRRSTNKLNFSNRNLDFKSIKDLSKAKLDLQHKMRASFARRNLAAIPRTLEEIFSRRITSTMRLRLRRKLITCDANCNTCSGTASNCTSCSGASYLAASYCYTTCPTPLFGVSATHTCDLECPSGQFKYDVDKKCYATCPNPTFLNPETAYCVDPCPDGMFKNIGEGKCTLCDFDCQTCSVSASNCLSCKNDWLKSGVSCLPPPNVYQVDSQLDSGFTSYSLLVNGAELLNNHISTCGPYRILGGTQDFGGDAKISKAYTNIVPHYKIRIRFLFLKIDKWNFNSDYAYLYLTPTISQVLFTELTRKTFTTYQDSLNSICGRPNTPEELRQFDEFVNHVHADLTFKITVDLIPISYYASWGIFDYKLYVYRCHETCLTCTGQFSTQCVTCYLDATKNANNECVCNNHFYPVTVPANTCTIPPCTVCTSCHSECNTCEGGSNTECIDCSSPRFLLNKQCYLVCPGQFFGTGVQCNPCDANCNTCSGTATTCTSCSGDTYLFGSSCFSTCPIPSYAVLETHTCDLQCPSGQFKYDVDKKCYATCPNPSFVNPQTEYCVDPCPDGMFKNSEEGKCTLCDFDCLTCSVSASSCLSCKNDWIKSGTSCLPPSNFYQVDSQLDSGFTLHNFLVNNADLLTDHSSYCGSYHILGGPNDFGQSTYISKTYTNIVPHYMIRIRFSFLKIDFWDSNTVSLYLNTSPEVLIDSKTFTSNQDSSLNLICGTGNIPEALRQFDVFAYHSSSSIELKITTNLAVASSVGSWGIYDYKLYVYRCHETCLTCTGQLSTQCDTCYPDATKNANNECICNNQFFPISVPANTCTIPPCTVCISCHSECKNCDGGSNTDCIDCSSPRFLLNKQCYLICPAPFFGTSDNRCQDGAGCIAHTYLDELDGACKSCHSDCDNCSGPLNTDCLSCLAPYFLLIKGGLMECVENCGNGFVGDLLKRICIACEATCETCNDVTKNNCLTCLFPRYFFQNQCLTFCPSKYYGNNATKTCENTCPPKTYIEKKVATCWPCSLECKICIGLSKDECIECEPNYYLQNTSCVSNCFTGYYVVMKTMKCEPCLTDCTKCINSTICEVCNGNKFLLMPDSKKCVSCLEEGYHLEENICYSCASNCKICEDKTKCMECLSGYFQSKGKCLIQERISAQLSKDSTIPNRFYLNFNKKWNNAFQLINSNIKFNITDINPDDFSYKIYSNPSVENGFIIDLTFKKDLPQGHELIITFINLPTTNYQFFLEKKNISLSLNEFHVCSKGMVYNLQVKSCLNTTLIKPSLDYTMLSNEITLSFDNKFDAFWKILPQNSNVTIENLNFTYEFLLKENDAYLIRFNFNTSFTNKPLCTVYLNIPENMLYEANNSFYLKENPIMINLKDYYLLSAQIQDFMQATAQVSSKMSSVAASTTMTNNALSFGSSFAITAMMSMDVIRFLKFIEIDYPPNVDEMFQSDSPVPGIVPNVEMDISEQETIVLPFIFRKNEVSIYLFNNNGNLLIENFTYFLFSWLIIGIKKHVHNTKNLFVKKIVNFFHSIFVWNFVISYYLGVLMNYIFFALIFLKFPATFSPFGKFNFALAIFELFSILCSLLYLSLKIKQMHDKSVLKIPLNKIAPTNISLETANFIKTDKQLKFDTNDMQSELKPNKSIFDIRTAFESSPLFLQDSPNQIESGKKYSNKKENENSSQEEFSKMSPLEIFNKVFTLKNSSNIADFNSQKITKSNNIAPTIGDSFKIFPSDQPNSISLKKKSEGDLKSKVGYSDKGLNSWSNSQLNLSDEKNNSRYSCLYDDLKHLNLGQSYFLMFDVFRQILISIMIVTFYNIPIIALSAINFVNFEILILLIFIRPLKNRIDFIHISVNEICINIACWSSFALAFMQVLEMGDANLRMNIGWIMIGANGLLMLAVVIRLTILLVESCIMIVSLMKKYIKDRKEAKRKKTEIYDKNFKRTDKEENKLKIVDIQE